MRLSPNPWTKLKRRFAKTGPLSVALDWYSVAKIAATISLGGARAPNFYRAIHDQRRAIFIHVPKAAGNTVAKVIYGVPSMEVGGHIKASQFRLASPQKFSRYFSFAFVRNPYDRLYSAFTYLKAGGMNDDDLTFSKRYLREMKDFRDFVLKLKGEDYKTQVKRYVHFVDQREFVCNEYGSVIVNRIGRYERFRADLVDICAKIGVPFQDVHENRSAPASSSFVSEYDEEMADIVYEIYKDDFETFGYSRNIRA